MAFLEVSDLKAFYGQTEALHGLDFSLEEGSITAILGANGAGTGLGSRACGTAAAGSATQNEVAKKNTARRSSPSSS